MIYFILGFIIFILGVIIGIQMRSLNVLLKIKEKDE